jgi:hypothetical protein
MKRYLSLVAVVAVSVISASAQMVPFTSSGTSSVTPFVNLALKNNDRSEYTFGAMYMTSFGLGIQADYGIGNGLSRGNYTSNSEMSFQLGYSQFGQAIRAASTLASLAHMNQRQSRGHQRMLAISQPPNMNSDCRRHTLLLSAISFS